MSKRKLSRLALSLMGRRAVVMYVLRRHMDGDNKVSWRRVSLPRRRVGWIVGVRYPVVGTYLPASGGGSISPWGGDDNYEPPELRVNGTIPCFAVVFWPTMAPVYVHEQDLFLINEDDPPELEPMSPAKWGWENLHPAQQKRVRETLNEERDPTTGRF